MQREGYVVEFGGQFEAQQSASRTLLVAGAGIAVVMLLLLQLSTGSFKVAALVMINLPLATIGGIAAVFITDSLLHAGLLKNTLALLGIGSSAYLPPVLSIASLVGFITLFGIAVRNGILLVNHYRHLIEVEHKALPDAIVQGSMERLVPILMTALSAALGLVAARAGVWPVRQRTARAAGGGRPRRAAHLHLPQPVCGAGRLRARPPRRDRPPRSRCILDSNIFARTRGPAVPIPPSVTPPSFQRSLSCV